MTFRRLYLVYALIMSAVIASIVFNKGAMFREILRDGIRTTGKVTSLQREFPRGESRIRVRIEWSAGGRASTLVTLRTIPSKATAVGAPVRQCAVTFTATEAICCIAISYLLPRGGYPLDGDFV